MAPANGKLYVAGKFLRAGDNPAASFSIYNDPDAVVPNVTPQPTADGDGDDHTRPNSDDHAQSKSHTHDNDDTQPKHKTTCLFAVGAEVTGCGNRSFSPATNGA